jgi:hydrogenase expression/formation protein HypE
VPGDKVLVNGCLGDHGLTIMLQRAALDLDNNVASDCAPLNLIITELLKRFSGIKIMRDLTRGGFATNAKEIAMSAQVDFRLEEKAIPVDSQVQGITALLGLDPLYLANEGKFLVVAAAEEAEKVLEFLQSHSENESAAIVGEIQAGNGNVYLKTAMGGTRPLQMMAGAPLPRIC